MELVIWALIPIAAGHEDGQTGLGENCSGGHCLLLEPYGAILLKSIFDVVYLPMLTTPVAVLSFLQLTEHLATSSNRHQCLRTMNMRLLNPISVAADSTDP